MVCHSSQRRCYAGMAPEVPEVDISLNIGASQLIVVTMVPDVAAVNAATDTQGPQDAYDASVVERR